MPDSHRRWITYRYIFVIINFELATIFKHYDNEKINILYWVFTTLSSAFMLMSAIPDILMDPKAEAFITALGYPKYIVPFLGVAKFLGVVAILIPGFARIKEWAYAGLFFDLIGATYSGIATSGFEPMMLMMLVPFTLGTLSYIYHHKRLRRQSTVHSPRQGSTVQGFSSEVLQ